MDSGSINKMKKNILNSLITDKNLVWDQILEESPSEFVVKLSPKSINEIKINLANLKDKNLNSFPFLNHEINDLKNNKIIKGVGLLLIDGSSFLSFSRSQINIIYEIISMILGELLEQDMKGSKIISVKNRGKSLSTGGRYHQTSDGGSYHTDGPHWKKPPDIIGLLCINPALEGGISKFVSVYTIHNKILRIGLDKLEPLYDDFFFDRREEIARDLRTISKPVFEFINNKLRCRFLKDYIISGHKIEKSLFSTAQRVSLNLVEEIIKEPSNALSYNLKTNDMLFSDNHRLFHGRTSFKDLNHGGKKRELLRVWINTFTN